MASLISGFKWALFKKAVFCVYPPNYLLYDVTMLRSVNSMLPVTLEQPTMFLYITITFSHTPLRPGRVAG